MAFDTDKLYAVIMAGGRGERFWPAGRKKTPKQLLALAGEKTLIEDTVQRLFPLLAPERILVITNRSYVEQVRALLPLPPENIIGEPEGRNTAPCVALATALVRRRDPAATMMVLPADHIIHPAKLFQQTLLAAAEAARSGDLVTLGIKPTYPATGFGYLRLAPGDHSMPCKVLGFREKPDLETAEKFIEDRDYRWNSGMFIWRTDAISAAFAKYAPALSGKLESWSNGSDYTADFAECEKISIDYAVMEKADNIIAIDAGFEWNDLGSWSALRSASSMDENGNTVRGKVIALESEDNVLISDDDTLLGVVGLRNMAVVKSGNGILVCPLEDEQKTHLLTGTIREKFPDFE